MAMASVWNRAISPPSVLRSLCCALVAAAILSWHTPADSGYVLRHIAGTDAEGFSGDGGHATLAELSRPSGLAVGPDGTLYVADTGNHRIRRISRDGIISTLAGNGRGGFAGDGGVATDAELEEPTDVAVDAQGTLYVVESHGTRLRRIDAKTGRIGTVLFGRDWSHVVTNDWHGNVAVVAIPTGRRFPFRQDPFAIHLRRGSDAEFSSLRNQVSRDLYGDEPAVYAVSLHRSTVLRFAWEHSSSFGVFDATGRHFFWYDWDCYTVGRPDDIASMPNGSFLFSARMFHGGSFIIQQRGRRVFHSIAGYGQNEPAEGMPLEQAALEAGSLAVHRDGTIYVLHGRSQVFALERVSERRGAITGHVVGRQGGRDIAVYAESNGAIWYAGVDRGGRFLFSDLPWGSYRVHAQHGEEGLSCDASDCGWSGAGDDCPRTRADLNDPIVYLSPATRHGRVKLRLLSTFPCI